MDTDNDEIRVLSQRLEAVAQSVSMHNSAPVEYESSNDVVVNRWITRFSAIWKVGAVIAFVTFAWANINNTVENIKSTLQEVQDNCKTANGVLYKELERSIKDTYKDMKYADTQIDANIYSVKKDILVIVDNNKKEMADNFRVAKDEFSNELTSNSAAITQIMFRYDDHVKKTEAALTTIPDSINIHVKSLNEKIDKFEDNFTIKINNILMDMTADSTAFNSLSNDFLKVSNKVDELERTVYRGKGK